MNEDIKIIEKLLPEMAGILNAIPGERFELKCAKTLMIMARRLKESEYQRNLLVYTQFFPKEEAPDTKELADAAVAFVKIKTLSEADRTEFDQVSLRKLFKEFNAQKTKVLNIIRLSKVNALTAEDYQKEVIKKTLDKSEMFLKAFEDEIRLIEKKIEKEPVSLIKPKETEVIKEEDEVKPLKQKKYSIRDLLDKMEDLFEKRRCKKVESDILKEEEERYSSSGCKEIPYYDAALKYSESHVCKDIPEFSVFVRKGNVYFGFSKNASAGVYDNRDQSLLELMNVSNDFIQFMTTDLLSGDYDLKPFTDEEKKAMQLYFNYICVCFEKHIGKVLSVQEYLHFKDYYNRLILKMFLLEEKERSNYYRALPLADAYTGYMSGYDLSVADDKEDIIRNIISGKSLNYTDDLKLILDNHVVSEEAREKMIMLSESIRCFNLGDEETDTESKEPYETVDFKGAKIVIDVMDEVGEITDEAVFSSVNMETAVKDYLKREAYRKRIGIEKDGERIFFFTGRNNAMSLPAISNSIRETWNEEDKTYFGAIEEVLYRTMIRVGGYFE